jgi:hypothetical protein
MTKPYRNAQDREIREADSARATGGRTICAHSQKGRGIPTIKPQQTQRDQHPHSPVCGDFRRRRLYMVSVVLWD